MPELDLGERIQRLEQVVADFIRRQGDDRKLFIEQLQIRLRTAQRGYESITWVFPSDPERVVHTYRWPGSDAEHQHDGKTHTHEGGDQFHYHYPGIPPGWEPAYLEG